jgi:DnaJ-class molecular chaperone
MTKSIKCHCGGRPSCKLCNGTSAFQYEVGPRGYLPFACPTCAGRGYLEEPGIDREKCFTCRGNGTVDPADPPSHGFLDIIWKSLFGA